MNSVSSDIKAKMSSYLPYKTIGVANKVISIVSMAFVQVAVCSELSESFRRSSEQF